MGFSGNKGEWSEIYALFKLLGDGYINVELTEQSLSEKKVSKIIYPIIKIIREENNSNLEYFMNENMIIFSSKSNELLKISMNEFSQKAIFLLAKIKQNNKTFEIPEIENFMRKINCNYLKAKSSRKTDITIVIHDVNTNQQPVLGFSIKSELGKSSTLLNASQSTNLKYQVTPELSKEQIAEINSITTKCKIRDRITKIQEYGSFLKFVGIEQGTFANNLILIDSCLPKILAQIVLKYYVNNLSKIFDLVSEIETLNPLKYDKSENHQFYSYKIKRFLVDVALGMMPSKVWKGDYDSTGGYLVVKENGEICCYHLYNLKFFENYLLSNTKIDTPSSTRHNFGVLYEEDNKLFIKLNFQIRFV